MPNGAASRVFDVAVATFALLILSPVMLVIAAAIVLEIGRPVFFTQRRLGQGGRIFRIYKFRKFRTRDGTTSGPLLTVRGDPRMSRIGRLLERSKLDELPQFWNVLTGDMAIVGWRPDTEVGSDRLIGEYRALLDHKPGIFGPAQVAFRNAGDLYPPHVHPHDYYRNVILPMKARLDLDYYPCRTLARDFVWMIRGVLAVIGIHPTVRDIPAEPLALQATERCAGPLALASATVASEFAEPQHQTSEYPAR